MASVIGGPGQSSGINLKAVLPGWAWIVHFVSQVVGCPGGCSKISGSIKIQASFSGPGLISGVNSRQASWMALS